MLVQIQHLDDAHALLCESSLSLTDRFGAVLLVDVLNLLLHFVATAYFFFTGLLLKTSPLSGSYVAMQAFWLAAHLSRLLLLVWSCSKAKQEANRTGALIGMFMNNIPANSALRRQLEMFTMQLMHHRVTFSACGLFELELPLVVNVLGSVTTYLVVLLQLKGPSSNSIASSQQRK
ncbi:gustatory receptor for sugar taste 43a-like [Thrips palmi]|uniref:Gustatory receptor for sugar taste 43a-like n=1 Tax=Thrips palmi TaxID=161013 RepID=A0A6P9AFA2_THRPL|nr:gustatory receptor for sugar taste 43a-like [Thrips palmi]